ncbi:MAG: hypothetical protein PF961_11350 [Planctomycetota bacterium]|nr:hypothetical protein [Planctomycetota bacterium]
MRKQPTPHSGSKRISLSGRLPTDPPLMLSCWYQSCREDCSQSYGDLTRDEAIVEFESINFAAERAHCQQGVLAGGKPWPFGFGISAPRGACVQILGDHLGECFNLLVERPVEEKVLGFIKRTRTERRQRISLDSMSVRAAIKTAFDSVDDLFR